MWQQLQGTRVRRALLDSFPFTILSRSASDEWLVNAVDKSIFIDRDADRFRYCLDYMRDGRVVMPFSASSKAALLTYLAYYGFEEVDPKSIEISMSATSSSSCLVRGLRSEDSRTGFARQRAEMDEAKISNWTAWNWCRAFLRSSRGNKQFQMQVYVNNDL